MLNFVLFVLIIFEQESVSKEVLLELFRSFSLFVIPNDHAVVEVLRVRDYISSLIGVEPVAYLTLGVAEYVQIALP